MTLASTWKPNKGFERRMEKMWIQKFREKLGGDKGELLYWKLKAKGELTFRKVDELFRSKSRA